MKKIKYSIRVKYEYEPKMAIYCRSWPSFELSWGWSSRKEDIHYWTKLEADKILITLYSSTGKVVVEAVEV